MVYLAYGSNMLIARLRRRAPSAARLGITCLPGYELRFSKKSTDGSAKCDLRRNTASGTIAYGVVFTIDDRDIPELDDAEGCDRGYRKDTFAVEVEGHGLLDAVAYIAERSTPDSLPYDWYVKLVLAGAIEHGLPDDYRAAIAATPSRPDPDPARAARMRSLLV